MTHGQADLQDGMAAVVQAALLDLAARHGEPLIEVQFGPDERVEALTQVGVGHHSRAQHLHHIEALEPLERECVEWYCWPRC